MTDTISHFTTYDLTSCANCGIRFCVPTGFLESRKEDLKSMYCPNGHSLSYSTSRLQEEQGKTARLERNLAAERRNAEVWRENARAEERSHRGTKGHLTRKKKELRRVSVGICPCCKREFQNLKRHMKGQHPGYEEHRTHEKPSDQEET